MNESTIVDIFVASQYNGNRQLRRSKCCNTVQCICNICSVQLDVINTPIHVSLYALYCTLSSMGSAFDVCLVIKRLFQAKFIICLSALLTEQFTRKQCSLQSQYGVFSCFAFEFNILLQLPTVVSLFYSICFIFPFFFVFICISAFWFALPVT